MAYLSEQFDQKQPENSGRKTTMTTYRDYPEIPEVTAWQYNSGGRLSVKKYADNSQQTYHYNLLGQLEKTIQPNGREINYTYDNAGRIASVSYSGTDTSAITYAYDVRGRLVQISDAAGVRNFVYNPDGTLDIGSVVAKIFEMRSAANQAKAQICRCISGL